MSHKKKILVHLNLFHNDKMGNTDGIERVLQICTSYFIDASHKHVVSGTLRSCRPWLTLAGLIHEGAIPSISYFSYRHEVMASGD
jgi:hypothetical protein